MARVSNTSPTATDKTFIAAEDSAQSNNVFSGVTDLNRDSPAMRFIYYAGNQDVPFREIRTENFTFQFFEALSDSRLYGALAPKVQGIAEHTAPQDDHSAGDDLNHGNIVSSLAKDFHDVNVDGSLWFDPYGESKTLKHGSSEIASFTTIALNDSGLQAGTSDPNITINADGGGDPGLPTNRAPIATKVIWPLNDNEFQIINLFSYAADPDRDKLAVFNTTSISTSIPFTLDGNGTLTYDARFLNIADGVTRTDTITYTVYDGMSSASGVMTFEVTGVASSTPDDFRTVLNGGSQLFTGLLDNDNLLPSSIPDSKYFIYLRDGIALVDSAYTTKGGVVTFETGTSYLDHQNLIYTPPPGFSGIDSFTYQTALGYGNTIVPGGFATIYIRVMPPPIAPIGIEDTYHVNFDSVLNISAAEGVLQNDQSNGGGTLYAQREFVFGLFEGQLDLNVDGSFIYNPDGLFTSLAAGQSQTVTFKYAAFNTQTMQVGSTVVNIVVSKPAPVVPVASNDTLSLNEDVRFLIKTLLDNDTTLAGTTLTGIRITSLSVDGVLFLNEAAVAVNSLITAADLSAGHLVFSPNTNFNGVSTFQYQANNGQAYSEPVTVTINVGPINDAPVRTGGTLNTITVNEDSATTTATSLGLAGLTYGPGGGTDEASQTLTYTITGVPSFITLWKADGETAVLADSTLTATELQGLKYKTVADTNGTGIVSWSVTDSGSDTFPDLNSISQSLSVTVTAVNDAPRLTNDTESVLDGSTVVVPATTGLMANDSDPDNGDSISVVGARIMGGESFATDVTDNYGTLHVNSDGSYRFTANGISSFELASGLKYIDTFEYQVKDAAGLTSNAQLAITITGRNQQPKAVTDNLFVDEGQTTSGSLIANDFDIDIGDKIAVTSVKSSTNIAYGITGPTAINFDFGTLNIDRTGSYSFTANGLASIALKAGQEHLETFAYRITDGGGLTSSASIEILIKGVNSEPAAKDDSADVNEDGALLAFNILSNDKDPDTGDVLHVSGVRKNSTDNFDTIPIDDDYGTLTLNADGTVSFQADGSASQALAAGAIATDIFTYQIKDAAGLTSNAQLSITITGVNDAPVASNDDLVLNEGEDVRGNLLTNDSDVDFGDTMHVVSIGIVLFDNSFYYSDKYVQLKTNSDGSYILSAIGEGSNALGAGQTVNRRYNYEINDGSGAPSTAYINVKIYGVNNAPIARDDISSLDEDGTPVTIYLRLNDNDPDRNDVFYVSGIRKSSTDDFVTTFIKDDYGTLTLNADGTVIFQADGSASQALAAGAIATDIFTYQIKDAAGLSATANLTLTITGVNDAPTARNDAYSYINTVGSVFTVDAAKGVLVDDTDPDSTDNLTVTGAGIELTTVAGQHVTLAADGSFVYDAANGFSGNDSFTYTATDGHGDTSTATVNLTVTAPPKLADLFLINEIAVNTGSVTFTINTDNGVDLNTVTTGPAHIEIIKSSNTATTSAELRSMQVEIVNPNGGLSVISMSQLVGLTVDKAGNPLNLSSAIAAGGSLELFEPNNDGLGIWAVYDSKGTLKLSGTYHDNAWHLGADVNAPIAVNLAQAATGASLDLFIANGALISNLQGIDTTQSWLSGVGSLGTAPHALGSVSPFVLPEKLFAWYGGAQLSPLGVPADVTALLALNKQFNASLASIADTVFVRVYDNYLNNGIANGLDKVFIDNNDAGDWTYGPKTILSDGYKNIAGKDSTKFVPNPLDPYDNMNPLQGTGKHGDVIASITNEDGQTIAIFSGFGTGGSGHDFLYGVNSDDVLLGASGDDFIYGSAGNDTLWGGSGGDSLSGGAGNDVLYGGTGKDKLLGGIGADVFAYRDTNESSAMLADVIGDFTPRIDKIDLSAIDAKTSTSGNQAFLPGGFTSAVKANSVTWYEDNGNTIIQIDNTGNTVADIQLVLTGTGLGLTTADFIL